MEHAKANKRSWLRDEQMLNHLGTFFGKEVLLAEITPIQIEDYKLQRRGKIADSTVNRELAIAQAYVQSRNHKGLVLRIEPGAKGQVLSGI